MISVQRPSCINSTLNIQHSTFLAPEVSLRAALITAILVVLALPLHAAQPCNLQISMSCTSGKCTSTTVNNGANACSGQYIAAFFSEQASATVSGITTTLGLPLCFDSSTFPGAPYSF